MTSINKIQITTLKETDKCNESFWTHTKGENVKVAIIDTGIDMNHPDLKYSYGIDMFVKSNDVNDLYGHGTHVAGLIAGKHTGMAPNAELYIAKVLNSSGHGSIASVMDGITFAINCGVDILCMSLGMYDELPNFIHQRLTEAYNSGITIVSATGNSGEDRIQYPANTDEVIAVGGLDKDNKLADFSNYGINMDVVAPADEILSTFKNGQYATMSGTSMACATVTGQLALLISYYKSKGKKLSPIDIKNLIATLGEHNYLKGYGAIDLNKLI